MQDEFSFEITEHIATLKRKGDFAVELNRVSFNGGVARLDLRQWYKPDPKPLKGISLTTAEARKLQKALAIYFDRKDSKYEEKEY